MEALRTTALVLKHQAARTLYSLYLRHHRHPHCSLSLGPTPPLPPSPPFQNPNQLTNKMKATTAVAVGLLALTATAEPEPVPKGVGGLKLGSKGGKKGKPGAGVPTSPPFFFLFY